MSCQGQTMKSTFMKSVKVSLIQQEAQLMLTNLRDAFSSQSRSPNIVPFHMLGKVSSCAIVTLSLRGGRRFYDIQLQKCRDLEIGVRGHSRSLKVVPFERLCMVCYYCSLVTLSLKRTVFEMFDFKNQKTVPYRLCAGHLKFRRFCSGSTRVRNFPNFSRQQSLLSTHLWACHGDRGDPLYITGVYGTFYVPVLYKKKQIRFPLAWAAHARIRAKFNPQVHFMQRQFLPNFIQIGRHLGKWRPKTCFFYL